MTDKQLLTLVSIAWLIGALCLLAGTIYYLEAINDCADKDAERSQPVKEKPPS